jgi:hypothetical protein
VTLAYFSLVANAPSLLSLRSRLIPLFGIVTSWLIITGLCDRLKRIFVHCFWWIGGMLLVAEINVGVYMCSPMGDEFKCKFDFIAIVQNIWHYQEANN